MNDFQIFMNSNDRDTMTAAQAAVARQARHRIETLLGPPPLGGHTVERGGTGPCRICGVTAPLTFEHVPPKSSGNVNRRRAIDTETALTQPGIEMPRSGWIQMQRGAGAHATCRDCNSFGGTEYVPAYSDAVAAAVIGLQGWASSLPEDDEAPETLRLQASRHFQPGAVIRQALFMLMAMSGSAGLLTSYPDLRAIVLDKKQLRLPPEMVIRLTLLMGPNRYRISPIMGDIDWTTGNERALIDVAHVPFGWLAEIGPPSDRPAIDVSGWTEIAPDDLVDIDLTLPIGSVVTAAPGDYRHPWQIPGAAVTRATAPYSCACRLSANAVY